MAEPAHPGIDWHPRALKVTRSDTQHESVSSRAIDLARRAPIDFDHLRRYTLGDAMLEREVLELFCRHAPVLLAALRDAGSERSWRDAAHSLKGSARAIGAWEVAKGAELAEIAAAPERERRELVTRLEAAVGRIQRFTTSRRALA